MENSPFNRSGLTRRSPPPTPAARSPNTAPVVPVPVEPVEVVPTSEIQNWMSSIEQYLNEVCSIAAEGKLNSDQKLRISNLCRKVGHGTSQLAVQYQALKQKALQTHSSLQSLKEKEELSVTLSEIKQAIKETSSNAAPANMTFAEVIKKGTNSFLRANKFSSLAIYPKDKEKTSDDTKSLVQKIICPEQLKLQVRGLRRTKNGGVIISTEKKDDIEKLKNSVQTSTSGLTVDETHKRRPRIVVIGVPTTLADTEVFNCIYEQNLAEKLPNLAQTTFLSSIKLSHKSGRKNAELCNYVIEVPANIRKALISQDRVFINWSSCPVRDFTLVTRCYKCQQYGHAAKTCKEAKPTCSHCGELGHQLSECTKLSEPSKCATCMRYKKPCEHKTGDLDCPAKKNAKFRYVNSIDYEST